MIPHFIKSFLTIWPFAFTRKQRQYRLLEALMKRICKPGTLNIDVDAKAGKVLQLMIKYSPQELHYAIETDPRLYFLLVRKFGSAAHIFHYNLGSLDTKLLLESPEQEDVYKNRQNPDNVQFITIDQFIPIGKTVGLIKCILTECTYNTIMGAIKTIQKDRPIILLEMKPGSGFNCHELYEMFTSLCYQVNTVNGFLKQRIPFSIHQFCLEAKAINTDFFIAYPTKNMGLE